MHGNDGGSASISKWLVPGTSRQSSTDSKREECRLDSNEGVRGVEATHKRDEEIHVLNDSDDEEDDIHDQGSDFELELRHEQEAVLLEPALQIERTTHPSPPLPQRRSTADRSEEHTSEL